MSAPRRFFSRPNEFSFKDLLAATTVGFFIFFSVRALSDEQALELVRIWVTLIAIVLGGYFGQEIASTWQEGRNDHERG